MTRGRREISSLGSNDIGIGVVLGRRKVELGEEGTILADEIVLAKKRDVPLVFDQINQLRV